MQPCPQLPFPFLSAALRWLGTLEGCREEQGPGGPKGTTVQPQATYVRQPDARVFQGHIQQAAGHLLVKDAGISHRLDGHKDDVCPLVAPEVFSKGLWQQGRKTWGTERPEGAAWLSSSSGPGQTWPALLTAVPAAQVAAVPAVPAWQKMSREGPPAGGGGLMGTECWPHREPGTCWWPGALELLLGLKLLLGHWSADPRAVPAQRRSLPRELRARQPH